MMLDDQVEGTIEVRHHRLTIGPDANSRSVIAGKIVIVRAGERMKRMGTAWDVASAPLFLVSDDAQSIAGAEWVVDGGLTCKA
jgi:NAD(P)-dependent dehydrogenase (short-subunit alcohol dehydrogenase family)